MLASYNKQKVSAPPLPMKILHRSTLVQKLAQATSPRPGEDTANRISYKLIILHTPAGYGKTALLADFIQQTSIPCCWYFLDHADTDQIHFLEYLIASIRHRFPHFSTAIDSLLAGALSSDERIPDIAHLAESILQALAFMIELEISEPFVFILSNYHEVNKYRTINDLVSLFLQYLPRHCILVIESRAFPELNWISILTHREMLTIGFEEMRFTGQEISELSQLYDATPLSLSEAEQLAQLFDGWITGILLGTHLSGLHLSDVKSLQGHKDAFAVRPGEPLHINREHLFVYLMEEVFQHEPDLYLFLRQMSILRQMTPASCFELLGTLQATEYLYTLAQQGFFVYRSDQGPEEVYVCHPILRELLFEELRRCEPARYYSLHECAANMFHRSGDYEQAIYHILEAENQDKATIYIIEAYHETYAKGHIETLARWIDSLDSTTHLRAPRLLLLRANIYLLIGNHVAAFTLLQQAQHILNQPEQSRNRDIDGEMLQETIAIAHSKALFQAGEYLHAQTICEALLPHLPKQQVVLRAEAHIRIGCCANMLGDFSSGIAHLQKALQLLGRQAAELHSTLASTYCLIGNFALATHHLTQAISHWEHVNNEWGKIQTLIHIGLVKHRQGNSTEAERALQEALTTSRNMVHFRLGEAYALAGLAEIYQDEGLYERSLHVNEEALALALQIKDHYLINSTLCTLAMTYLLMGDVSTPQLLLTEMTLPSAREGTVEYEKLQHDLTYSMVLIYQQHYQQAYVVLVQIDEIVQRMGLWRELLQVKLRLAACQYHMGQLSETIQHLEAVCMAMKTTDYNHFLQIELRRLSDLEQALKIQPELADMRKVLLQKEKKELYSRTEDKTIPLESIAPTHVTVTTMPRLTIRAFGEPTVLIEDKLVTRWRMGRAMELYFYMLHCNRPMNKAHIVEALWAEENEHIFQSLYSAVHYLKKTLGAYRLVSRKGAYMLPFDAGDETMIWYDVAVFEKHRQVAWQALADSDETEAQRALLAMVAIYRGDYVQSFYSDWCISRRDHLRRDYLHACQHLAQITWRKGQFEESEQHWLRMLAVDSCLEEAHYGLMRCYLSLGKRGLALRQYHHCEKILQQEMGVYPGTKLQQFYQELVAVQ